MGKKKASSAASSKHSHLQSAPSLTLREESSGKKHGGVNVKAMLKLDHIKSLANWASGEACIPSLGAFFGHRLAASAEALGVPSDPSLFSCQRCESILQPGYNCTVRIEKIKAKVKRRRRFSTQNTVVYKCHFCSHQNIKRGTPKGYMKELCPPKAKLPSKSDLTTWTPVKCSEAEVKVMSKDDPMSKKDEIAPPEITSCDPAVSYPTTPLMKAATLLDMGKRKRSRARSKKAVESESSPVAVDSGKPNITSSKRKRKSWTSLKEIAKRNELDGSRNLTNLTNQFLL